MGVREIIFRGKRKDNGEWVYGWYCGKTCDAFFAKARESAEIIEEDTLFWYEVIPETVGQYTGLTDKNGTKIFEGDILMINDSLEVRVFFENGQFVISHYALNLLSGRNLEGEVIGNIHE